MKRLILSAFLPSAGLAYSADLKPIPPDNAWPEGRDILRIHWSTNINNIIATAIVTNSGDARYANVAGDTFTGSVSGTTFTASGNVTVNGASLLGDGVTVITNFATITGADGQFTDDLRVEDDVTIVGDGDVSGALNVVGKVSGGEPTVSSNLTTKTYVDSKIQEPVVTEISTSGAVTSNMFVVAVGANETIMVQWRVTGNKSDSTQGLGNFATAVWRRSGGGSPTRVGSDTYHLNARDDTSWETASAASGNNVVIQCTGNTGDDVDWDGILKIVRSN